MRRSGRLAGSSPECPGCGSRGRCTAQPRLLAARVGGLAGELGRVVVGTSQVAPSRRDRRFTDPAWTQNPLLRRAVQGYLATATTVAGLVEDVPMSGRDTERMRFVTENLVDALAPSNNPLLSPAAWKAVIDTGGRSVATGAWHLLRDMSTPPRVPEMVPADAFEVGADLGVTPGEVVRRDPVFELIQYRPADLNGSHDAAGDHPADDQQVLRPGPGTGP